LRPHLLVEITMMRKVAIRVRLDVAAILKAIAALIAVIASIWHK
jgi:hypothetical protein